MASRHESARQFIEGHLQRLAKAVPPGRHLAPLPQQKVLGVSGPRAGPVVTTLDMQTGHCRRYHLHKPDGADWYVRFTEIECRLCKGMANERRKFCGVCKGKGWLVVGSRQNKDA